jgi:amidophosphoribosyltransferase
MMLLGMSQLQHRGQDASGLFTYNTQTNTHHLHKKSGSMNQAFPPDMLPLPDADWGIGHLRYATVGAGNVADIQPHVIENSNNTIAMVHNGNIVNYVLLKDKLLSEQTVFQTSCDTEIILHLFNNRLSEEGSCTFDTICASVDDIYNHIFGSYSILSLITEKGIVAFRDPWGFRPLLYGVTRDGETHIFSSESGPFNFFDVDTVHDIEPGEVIYIDQDINVHRRRLKDHLHAHCSFEFNYFAKANTVIEKREVYQARKDLGTLLAKNVKTAGLKIDAIVPIPESGRTPGLALGRALNIPVDEGFIKQENVGRTFIMPSQKVREKAVSKKLTPVHSVFRGKKILLVDDSIIRGTVSRYVVSLARKAGATHVYFASTYPPVRFPCFYGIDFPLQKDLVAWERTNEEIAREIGADGVIYNSVEDLEQAIGLDDLCTACLKGEYPTKIEGVEELQLLRICNLNQLDATCKH